MANTFEVGTLLPHEHLVKCLITRLGCDATGTDPAHAVHPPPSEASTVNLSTLAIPRALIG